MVIRPYKPADKKQLIEIFKSNTPTYFDLKESQDFETYLKQNGNTYLTIEMDTTIVGGTGYYINEKENSGSITWIFFEQDYSDKGLGRHAVEHCHVELRKDKRVQKFVVNTSQHAYGFFEKLGYALIRIEKDYWGEALDLYEMEMPNI